MKLKTNLTWKQIKKILTKTDQSIKSESVNGRQHTITEWFIGKGANGGLRVKFISTF